MLNSVNSVVNGVVVCAKLDSNVNGLKRKMAAIEIGCHTRSLRGDMKVELAVAAPELAI